MQRVLARGWSGTGKTLSYGKQQLQANGADNVLIRYLAGAVTTTDANCIHTNKPLLGRDGVGVVESSGSASLQPGDLVFPVKCKKGSYWSHEFVSEADLVKLPVGVDPIRAACYRSLLTAYFLSRTAEAGETMVVSNAGTAVGLAVIQFAKQRGINVVALISNKCDFDTRDELIELCKHSGAAVALCSAEAATDRHFMKYATETLQPPAVVINMCADGLCERELARTTPTTKFINTVEGAKIETSNQVQTFQLPSVTELQAVQDAVAALSETVHFPVEIVGVEDIKVAAERASNPQTAPYMSVVTHESPQTMFPTKSETDKKRFIAEERHAMWTQAIEPFMKGDYTSAYEEDISWWNSEEGKAIYKPKLWGVDDWKKPAQITN